MTKRAVVVGAGPNGLSAAITLARAGVQVEVLEANERIGGGARTEEVTVPGFWHDTGSSVYPMGKASPFFRSLPLADFGLRWIEPDAPLAHPLDDGTAVMLEHSLAATAEGLGEGGAAYREMMEPLVEAWPDLVGELLGPIVHLPKHAIGLARFGLHAVLPATALGKMLFGSGAGEERGRALLAGLAGHSVMPLEGALSAAVALVLGAGGHAYASGMGGWPVVEGGAQRLTEALAGYLRSLGGEIRTGVRVERLAEVEADAVLCDVTPRQLLRMGAEEMQGGNRRLMERYSYGPGSFKIDWALKEPIPWTAKDCLRAGTVHVGGTMEEIAESERAPFEGRVSERPFLILVQPSLFDPSRVPGGEGHTAWAYCHVPNGWDGDATEEIEQQVERFAPGFRECVVGRKVWGARTLERWNANLVGGDLSGGAMTPWQMVVRPTPRLWETSIDGVFLCSSSTPPGGGVHGMCGFLAGEKALAYLRG